MHGGTKKGNEPLKNSRIFCAEHHQDHDNVTDSVLASSDADDVVKRQEAIEESPSKASGDSTGLHGVQAVHTPCEEHHKPRPVQTGNGSSATPLFHCQFVSLGRFPSSLGNRPSSLPTSRWRATIRCAARLDIVPAQEQEVTASQCLLQVLGLERCELQWTLGAPRRHQRITPLLAVTRSAWGTDRMFSGLWVVACHCGCTEDSQRRQGSHLPYTSVGLLRQQRHPHNP